MNIDFYCLTRDFYLEHKDDTKLLDMENVLRDGKKSHVFLRFSIDRLFVLVPIRRHIAPDVRVYGRIGHLLPTDDKPDAGLDFRNAIIIEDIRAISYQTKPAISKKQYHQITGEYGTIKSELELYIRGFISSYLRKTYTKRYLYKDSTLVYFTHELGID